MTSVLSPVSEIFAVRDLQLSQVLADYTAGSAPTAPSAPSAPTPSGAGSSGGSTSRSYTVVMSNGTDSAASTAGTAASGVAVLSAASPIVVTLAAAPPAGSVAYVIATVRPEGTGLLATLGAGQTAFTDDGSVVPNPYTANQWGAGILYGPKIDIPGIQTMEVSGAVKNSMLRGDFSLLDSFSVLQDLKVGFSYAKINQAAQAVMVGGSVITSGSAPNRQSKWRLKRTSAIDTTNRFKFFKLEGASIGADPVNGDVHFVLPKCILSEFPKLGMAEEDYEKFSASATVVPRVADDLWVDVDINETLVPIGIGQ